MENKVIGLCREKEIKNESYKIERGGERIESESSMPYDL